MKDICEIADRGKKELEDRQWLQPDTETPSRKKTQSGKKVEKGKKNASRTSPVYVELEFRDDLTLYTSAFSWC
jgi:hypothetical protein